jgi:hypothetical protein
LPAPPEVLALVDRFALHRDDYRSGNYNETQLRREFIDPLFEALGWDVLNRQGHAESYKDVIHEDAIKIGGATKAPDYCFRIGGVRKFFVEAKKPSVNLKDDPSSAYQLRRYAWSAKLPLSILTDFEELAVYDCRSRPSKDDRASQDRTLYIRCEEFAERWDEISSVFARESILRGSFDRYAESKRKRGTAEVDGAFLDEIEGWRDVLARHMALRNPELGSRELNFAVQRTIDRLVFLRICEDRGIEPYGRLQGLLNGPNVYGRLRDILRQADDRYNSGLFHFQREKGRGEEPDELTLTLEIDDKPLKEIIRNLYYPDSPYEFSVLGADILGQVYEQFLGKIIRLTPGHRAIVEDKPEVKKAGGVFYTPTYVVEYLVERTLGPLLAGRTPRQAAKLRVLDPACGSGSFLIGAYQYLLDWHHRWYLEHDPKRWTRGKSPPIYQITGADRGGYRLTSQQRKQILLNNIYGVDIDQQAVEVTKLSLLLKVLEGESRETLDRQMRFLQERALPDLADNIKCGNSLIAPDFYQQRQSSFLDDEERLRINVFDWSAEFPAILRQGGFDAIIGNPPYIRMEMFKELKDYLRARYVSHSERSDLYVYFVEREHALLRAGGRFGMIVSNKFLRAQYGAALRGWLRETAHIERIVDLAGLPVFRGATVRTVLLSTRKGKNGPPTVYSEPPPRADFLAVEAGTSSLAEVVDKTAFRVNAAELLADGWRLLRPSYARLLKRLKGRGESLHQYMDGRICMGIKSGLTDAFVISLEQYRAITKANPKAKSILRPFLQGRDIRRYRVAPVREYLIYTHHGIDMRPYPAVLEHLRPFRKQLEARATRQEWYELQQPQQAYMSWLEQPKIVFPDIATECRFALDTHGRFGANTVYFLPTADCALLGLLNSQVAQFYFQQTCAALEGPGEAYLRFFGQYLEGFPVCLNRATASQRNSLSDFVDQRSTLEEKLAQAKLGHEQTAIGRQVSALDEQINQLVYRMYGLTTDDVRIVTEAVRSRD